MVLAAGLLVPITFLVLVPVSPVAGALLGFFFWASAVTAMWLLSPTVEVTTSQFIAGRATLEIHFVGEVEVFRGADARHQKGVGAHGLAWFCIRPWIEPMVRVGLNDPVDRTPYWIVSSRKPEQLASQILASQREHS